jgi:type IV secretory pathway VirJ component
MKRVILIIGLIHLLSYTMAQDVSKLPLATFESSVADTSKPLVVYLSGDGGVNSFSKSLCRQFNEKRYPVVLFNSEKYFWDKKTPAQAAVEVEKVISYYKNAWKKNKVILIGYSFGADIVPFVFTRLPKDVSESISHIVLLSPANKTDFEVHLNPFASIKNGSSIPEEINKINNKPILILQGDEEKEKVLPSSLRIRNYKITTLKGGHHYDNNATEVVNAVLGNIR